MSKHETQDTLTAALSGEWVECVCEGVGNSQHLQLWQVKGLSLGNHGNAVEPKSTEEDGSKGGWGVESSETQSGHHRGTASLASTECNTVTIIHDHR